jgi:excisionase family DNA binding protein
MPTMASWLRMNSNATNPQETFISAREIASRFGVSLRTVFRWKEDGLLIGHRIGGGRLVRYRLQEVDQALLGNKGEKKEA